MTKKKTGKLFIISGPSGSGKSTILREALPRIENAYFSISATTRAPRPTEEHGRDYLFIKQEEFDQIERQGGFLESARYVGNSYGTPVLPIKQRLMEGIDVILDIEVQGARQVKKKMPKAVAIFLFPPSMAVLEERLRARGTDPEEKILQRLERARKEYARAAFYDYLVINDEVERAVEEICAIITAEGCKLESRRHLIED